MSIPALSLSGHDRYTPEIRDSILEKLRAAPADETAYRMLSPARLRALAEIEASNAKVLSFYMQLSPDRRVGRAWHTVFSSLRDRTLKAIDDRRQRRGVQDEFDKVEQALAAELPALGRGVAFFSSRELGLWQQIAVSVSLPDGAYLRSRPYLRPLVRTRDEHNRFILVLLSLELNRFFISQIGQVEEVFQIRADPPRKALADGGPKNHPHVMDSEPMKNEARVLAHAAELVLAQFEGRYLLPSGALELRNAVMQYLPKHTRQSVGSEFSVEVHEEPADVAAAAAPAQREIEAREEVVTVQRLIDAGPDRSAWDVQPTLSALHLGRVMTLVVDDMFGQPGARCRNCGGLWERPSNHCPLCESDAIETVEDVVELAIERAIDESSSLEIVRSSAARRLLALIGPMAALLRW